ncbi:bifunctional diguanylate cyclase/phosphodiesterase [Pseudoroseomonas cervicalis]|uniref:putative bifunctional diguanylate cyclase/phosphodiesterase n=1 Tax=Teichococcus cervicalis TaxID=204525 RepID=UPI0022F1D9A0|nr:bifunctional diguanylate cyclase/phosphodiesterase [Pseudoroseomonas cervicalis]WBV42427.1 EAL domain-containing protein [Pseudoroseomonas cervicalis]
MTDFPPLQPPPPAAAAPCDAPQGDGLLPWTGEGPLDRLRTALWVYDIDQCRILWANPPALRLWRAESMAELASRALAGDMSPAVARRLRQYQEDFIRLDASFTELWTLYPRGEPRSLQVSFRGLRLTDGRMAMLCETVDDFAAGAETLRSIEALVHTSVMIALYAADGQILYRNPAARAALPACGTSFGNRFVDAEQHAAFCALVEREGEGRAVVRMRTARGPRWHEVTLRRCHDPATGQPAWLVSEVDVSELKEAERKADFLASHDVLTGLPNRASLHPAFARLREGGGVALMFIDLDGFKHVNDAFGHPVGDRLLVEVARRLRTLLRAEDEVLRLGGDEFLLLLRRHGQPGEVESVAERLREALSLPIETAGQRLQVTPSIGISLCPEHGTDVDELAKRADLALYEAKAAGRDGWCYFAPAMDHRARERHALEAELREALQRGEFELYYQPRLCVRSGRLRGAEALLRWNHPRLGRIAPDRFIGLCEETGLIIPLGRWVLGAAARQQRAWAARGLDLSVSVNISPRQFRDPDFLSGIARLVRDTGCDPRRLELEITESTLMGDDLATLELLTALRAQGFRLSIDDFGTGYSNLAYLQRYPVDSLKIDRSFLAGLETERPIAALVIAMGRLLKVTLVAEGVETQAQLDWLRAQGCEEYQGFLCSPPLPAAAMTALLQAESRALGAMPGLLRRQAS